MNETLRSSCIAGLVRVELRDQSFATGFRVGDHIITAAHCLPRVPDPVGDFPGDDHIIVSLLGHPLAKDPQISADALISFVDPCCDLAILDSSGSGGELQDTQLVAFENVLASLHNLTVCLRPLPLRMRVPAHVYCNDGQWIDGEAVLRDSTIIIFSRSVPGGTSGAPIFDGSGAVIGVVSNGTEGGRADPEMTVGTYLLNAVPHRLVRELSAAAIGHMTCDE